MNSVDYNNAFVTGLGGIAIKMVNKTGAASVKGTLVCPSDAINNAVRLTEVNDIDPIGAVFESGVPDGSEMYVVVAGVAELLLEDGTAATRAYWVRTSVNTAGRVDATNAAPPGGTVQALEIHMKECGHCLESVTAGTNKLAKCVIHFN